MWSTNVSEEVIGTCVVQLLDSGNLVLIEERSKQVVWQSFDYPTDTHLPGMKVGLNRKTGFRSFLTSWRSTDDPGIGDYSIELNPNGSPQSHSLQGYKTILAKLPMASKTYMFEDLNVIVYLGRTKIPWDWNILLDGSSGCVRKRQESSPVCRHGGGFVDVASVKIPDTSEAVWLGLNMSPMDCELECTRNCSCSAYASIGIPEKGTGCLAWYGELMDTTINMEDGNNIYVRVDALELAEIAKQSNHSLGTKYKLAVFVASDVSSWFIIILFSYLWFKKKGKRVRNKWNERLLDTINDAYPNDTLVANEGRTSHPDIAFFNLSTIITATNNFSPAKKVGQGGFGLVHEGQLSNGQEIAVKRLSKNSGQGIEEFKNEVMLIAKLQHKNLVKLIGCCIQGEEPMLVYEYLSNNKAWTHSFCGYMSPEYVIFGKFSTKSDVFSFGVILLEIITGKKNNSYYQEDSLLTMIGHIWHSWRENRPLEIVDSSLRESCLLMKY
ncbi:hypothetical protein GH714_001025 [Hevea brasiliensis]|uniref:non-specific serine/threonine protein kinase n=1 Tax=Hevea brasiliensis TaxID=3981 RepID=A0A6A6M9P7_HEVBR|nr:hypothetical protein GH714_001025 [Hevea brasiliensis]